MSITLHYFPLSTTSQKVRLCLFHKGIEVAEQIVDLIKLDQLRPEYLALNPNGQVPTLVVDGQPLYESSIINEFLEELKPQPALLPPPEDRVRRARIRMWTKYIDTGPTIQIASPNSAGNNSIRHIVRALLCFRSASRRRRRRSG